MALIVGCWHSMIVVGIVAHTQVFFDTKQNFHQMVVAVVAAHCCCYNNSNYSTAVDYLASFVEAEAAAVVGH